VLERRDVRSASGNEMNRAMPFVAIVCASAIAATFFVGHAAPGFLLRDATAAAATVKLERLNGRLLYFEDVEVRRSRAKGIACRVTLKKGEESFVGEAEGMENERSRIELAARAALQALAQAEPSDRALALDGVRLIEAFDREFVFVGITARLGRTSALLTGSCEIRESAETASVLAVLDATNRWIAHTK
jgi:hypothetical protein